MTLCEMTPDAWWKLCWIAGTLGFLWCGWALLRSATKKDERPEEGPKDW